MCSVDYCYPYPCFNNATCESSDTFECVCVNGYEGPYCESEINECLSDPCQNGGTCIDLFDAYLCECTEFFLGDNCEKGEKLMWYC